MRRLVRIDVGREPVPDETTVCRFRHLLEERDLGRPLFEQAQRHLAANGLKIARGTIVDAVLAKAGIINAPSSTKNAEKARDPEMHRTRKGNQWYFRYVALSSRVCGRTPSPNQRGSSRRVPWRGIR
jgi:transposase, IS5 family